MSDSLRTATMEQQGNQVFRSKRDTGFALYVVLLTAAFGRSLVELFADALQSDLNSYIVLIPFVSIYFFYTNRSQFSSDRRSSVAWALLPLLAGTIALGFMVSRFSAESSPNDQTTVTTLAFVSFLWAGGFLFLGRKWMVSAAFPMFFLIFLLPLPDQIVDWMETSLQAASADAANLFFALTNTPAMRTGTVFQLPGITLEVGQECSGVRSSWILFITSIIATKLFLSKPWSRITLVACVIPLGILRNGFRIMVIALLCIHVDPDMIHSIIHRRGGPIFFALSLVPLLFLLWFLRRQEGLADVKAPADAAVAVPTGTK